MPDYDSFSETPGMFAGRWWTMVLRGIVAILFAVLAFAWPGENVAYIDAFVWMLRAGGRRLYRVKILRPAGGVNQSG